MTAAEVPATAESPLPRYDENGIPDDPTLPIIPLLEGETTLPDGTIEGR